MTTPSPTKDPMLRQSLQTYRTALTTFASSPSTFRVLKSLPSTSTLPPPKTLYILDSSFNPPTLAHLRIVTTALLSDPIPTPHPKRLLLLLATQNADKAPKPTSFEQRLAMMEIFASELLSSLHLASSSANSTNPTSTTDTETIPNQTSNQNTKSGLQDLGVDIGITKNPYFADKALSISTSAQYPPSTPQIHLLGYDTLTRLLSTKYYPPTHTLAPLAPFLSQHRLLVTYRADDEWGEREEQDAYLRGIGEGKREAEGAKREWVTDGRIRMVEGRRKGEEAVSSTRVREAVRSGDREALGRLVTRGVAEWVLGEGLYLDD